MAVGSSFMVARPAAPVAYTQADFNRENETFKTIIASFPVPVTPVFSETVYEKADGVRLKTDFSCKHSVELVRKASITYTHYALCILNSRLLNADFPVERVTERMYKLCMDSLPKAPTELDSGRRTEMRRRVINLASSFFGKQLLPVANYLVASGKATSLQEAARSLVKDENGSFADALACDCVRAVTHKW